MRLLIFEFILAYVYLRYSTEFSPMVWHHHGDAIQKTRTVGVRTKARGIGELERARNTEVTIYLSFFHSPGTVEGSQRGRGEGRIPNFPISKLPSSLVYFKSRGVPTTASVAISTECTSPHSSHFFRALLRASRDNEIVGCGRERETWNTRDLK